MRSAALSASHCADHPSQGQTAEGEVLDVQTVGDRQRVAAKLLDRVLARGCVGRAVPAYVVPQDPEVLTEIRRLRVHIEWSCPSECESMTTGRSSRPSRR